MRPGALEQVGGAVARERLRDVVEAFDLALRQEREVEEDYEAWRLLLEQMKEADAAQANNLGRAPAPAIEGRFRALTNQRYQSVQLAAHLATEGVLAAGATRAPQRISVGTREQLRRFIECHSASTSIPPSFLTISSSGATATVWTGSAPYSSRRLVRSRSWSSLAGPTTTWWPRPWYRVADPLT